MDTQKKKFQFALDEETVVWERTYFTVEAETIEEARAQVMQAIKSGTLDELSEPHEYATLYETRRWTGQIEVLSIDRPEDGYRTEQTIYFTED